MVARLAVDGARPAVWAMAPKRPSRSSNHPCLRKYYELCLAVQDMPRHLGQHSGGMVICQGQLDSVVPLEPASMPGRVVVQWDKEDCARAWASSKSICSDSA